MKMKHKCIARDVLVIGWTMLSVVCLGDVVITPVRTKMFDIEKALQIYAMINNGKFPASLEELTQFIKEGHREPLLKKEDLIDPWGEPFEYEPLVRGFILRSSGPDRIMGTKDDMYSGYSKIPQESPPSGETPPVDGQGTNTVQDAAHEKPPVTGEGRGVSQTPRYSQEDLLWLSLTNDQKIEYRRKQIEERRRAHQSYLRKVKTAAALVLCFYAALPFLLKKLGRGVARRILIAAGIAIGIMVGIWCAGLTYVTWREYVRYSQQRGATGH